MTAKGFFITGTDTDVGKTYISIELIKRLKEQGNAVLGVKPICSEEGDVIALKKASGVDCDHRVINPVNYSGQVAPHLKVNRKAPLTAAELLQKCQKTLSYPYDYFIVEGCGGFLVPLNDHETMADFAKQLNFPVILVVNMRLGCLNHGLLTYHAIKRTGLEVAGWVANSIGGEMELLEDNILTLQHWIQAPYLGSSELEFVDRIFASGLSHVFTV